MEEKEKAIDCFFSSSVLWLGLKTPSLLSFCSRRAHTQTKWLTTHALAPAVGLERCLHGRSPFSLPPQAQTAAAAANPSPLTANGPFIYELSVVHRHQASSNYA